MCVCAEGAAASGAAYVRYVVPTPDDEEATVEYDLDEEDEEWLKRHNHKVPQWAHRCQVMMSSAERSVGSSPHDEAASSCCGISSLPYPAFPPFSPAQAGFWYSILVVAGSGRLLCPWLDCSVLLPELGACIMGPSCFAG